MFYVYYIFQYSNTFEDQFMNELLEPLNVFMNETLFTTRPIYGNS